MGLTKINSRFLFITTAVLLAAGSRLIPETWRFFNFTPVAAMAMFGGAFFSSRLLAYLIPFAALLISDAIIGFYGWGMLPVYGAFGLIVTIGIFLGKKVNPVSVLLGSLSSSVLFFLITNFAFFYSVSLYPHTWEGIVAGYAAGVPFFRSTLVSDLLFNILLFGSFYLAQLKFPKLSRI